MTARDFLAAVQQRADAATDGPWLFAYSSIQAPSKYPSWEALDVPEPHTGERRGECPGCPRRRSGCQHAWEFEDLDPVVAGGQASYGDTATGQRVKDAEFIAAARTDVPRLVAALTAVLNLAEDYDEWESLHIDGQPAVRTEKIRAVITAALTPKENDS